MDNCTWVEKSVNGTNQECREPVPIPDNNCPCNMKVEWSRRTVNPGDVCKEIICWNNGTVMELEMDRNSK